MFTALEIRKATRATLGKLDCPVQVKRVVTDSKMVRPGDLFVALKGARYDGHDFIEQAVSRGAAAVMVSRAIPRETRTTPVFRVKDTTAALGHLAQFHRQRFDIPIIAITGSAGKTTSKDLIAAVLSQKYRVLKNIGSQNNQIGVPLALLQLSARTEVAVLELGTNQPGDIDWLASLVRPTVAVMTNIGESHLKKLRSPGEVFEEKRRLLSWLPAGGTAILNGDDPFLRTISSRKRRFRVVSFGLLKGVGHQARKIRFENKKIAFSVGKREYKLNSPMTENIHNALSAICCGVLFKLNYNNINQSIERYRNPKSRQQINRLKTICLIDDTYNANPVSFRSALKTLSTLAGKQRKVLVCGDMLELGESSRELHWQIGELAAVLDVSLVLSLGRESAWLSRGFQAVAPGKLARHFSRRGDLHHQLARALRPRDVVLVKGSRGLQMDKTVAYLKSRY